MPLGQTSASEILPKASVPAPLKSSDDDVVDRVLRDRRRWRQSSWLPSIIAAESRYFVPTFVSGSHSQVTSGFLGSSSTLTALPSCGQVKALKASIASWLGASIHFSGSPTSGPPGGWG